MQRCRQLSDIPDEDLAAAARSATHVVLARGEHVFWFGAPGADVYVVDAGRIAARYRAADGRVVDMGVQATGTCSGTSRCSTADRATSTRLPWCRARCGGSRPRSLRLGHGT